MSQSESAKARYRCTQAALYSGCEIVGDNLDNNESLFSALKGKYAGGAVSNALRAAITAARALPDEDARGEASEILRIELKALNDKCLLNWQTLKRYIEDELSFSKLTWKPRLEAAGFNNYNKAGNGNWEFTITMNDAAMLFMTENTATLDAGGQNMPGAFPGQYATDALAYEDKYEAFMDARETGSATQAKILANNAAYAIAIEVCKDGDIIGKNDFEIAKLFTWAAIQRNINPPGSAAITIQVTNSTDNTPVANASIRLHSEDEDIIDTNLATDAEGVATASNIDPTRYEVTITATGCHTRITLKDINTGTHARLKMRLVPVVVEP
ncbi:MAG: carboxypeptidase regulatory-like domain-containing protein [Bacteroidetes bacterium]|nr:carboxypeptidase regulatory-like domain-containing protein [Bacteroidota bacterium]